MPALDRLIQGVADAWGMPVAIPLFAPDRVGDAEFRERGARYQRQTASPSTMRRLMLANDDRRAPGAAAGPRRVAAASGLGAR
jgi:hypothetical protein